MYQNILYILLNHKSVFFCDNLARKMQKKLLQLLDPAKIVPLRLFARDPGNLRATRNGGFSFTSRCLHCCEE